MLLCDQKPSQDRNPLLTGKEEEEEGWILGDGTGLEDDRIEPSAASSSSRIGVGEGSRAQSRLKRHALPMPARLAGRRKIACHDCPCPSIHSWWGRHHYLLVAHSYYPTLPHLACLTLYPTLLPPCEERRKRKYLIALCLTDRPCAFLPCYYYLGSTQGWP